MTKDKAEQASTTFRRAGWDVKAYPSLLSNIGWELRGKAADGGRDVYGFSHNDMKVLSGQVAHLSKTGGTMRHGYVIDECPKHGQQAHLIYLGGVCEQCAKDRLARKDAFDLRERQQTRTGVVYDVRKEADAKYHVVPRYLPGREGRDADLGNQAFGVLVESEEPS